MCDLQAENQRLLEFAHLVETATEAQDANGTQVGMSITITLHASWFARARALLAEADKALEGGG